MGFNKSIILAVLVVSMVFIAIGGFILNISLNYDVQIDEEFNDTFNRYAEANELVSDLDTIIEGGDINPDGSETSVYKNTIIAGKSARSGARLAIDMINQIPKIISVDAAIITILSSIIFLLITFGFIAMITRRNP